MSELSPMGALVRRVDPDRFLCALFAAPGPRETLFVLYALNHELARAWEVASLPPLALIRLHWWREVVEGAVRSHEVATPLAAELSAGRLDRDDLLALIDAREAEGGFAALAEWQAHQLAGPGGLAVAAGRALGARGATLDRLRALGAGYGVAGVLGNLVALAQRGRCLLPEDRLAPGLTIEDVVARPDDARHRPVLAELAQWGLGVLGTPQKLPPEILAAGLPGVLARHDLTSPGTPRAVVLRLLWARLRDRA